MAYRPAKKQAKDPVTGAPLRAKPEVDERNLIDTAESASLSFEDRIRIYWDENRTFIVGSIIVLLVVVIGYQGLVAFQNSRERAVRNEFAALGEDRDARIAFVEQRGNTAQGGFAALSIADELFSESAYARAGEFYQKAIAALGDNPLVGRAQLGQAFARLHDGDDERGRSLLEGIAENKALPQAIRAEAVFHLAVIAMTHGDRSAVDSLSARLDGMPHAQIWQNRLAEIR